MTAPALTIQQVHWRTLLRTRGELVSYFIGAVEIPELNVIVTRPGEDQIEVDENIAIANSQWDILIDPDTLIDGDAIRIVPAQGHVIVRADGTRYTVEPAGGSRNCWRWSDGLETWRRVHTVIERDK